MANVKVAVRVRPLNKRELDSGAKLIVDVPQAHVINVHNIKIGLHGVADSRERVRSFTFDNVFWSVEPHTNEYVTQETVFQELGTDVLQSAFQGYNASVFAYGQTGSGKTHTMMGYPGQVGLIPRICESLFSQMYETSSSEEDDSITYKTSVSYLEIYNERVRDLLRPVLTTGEKSTLRVREHPKTGPYVQDLTQHIVRDNEQIQKLIDEGNENRTTAVTHMHDKSSRSHAIFTVTFTQAILNEDLPREIVSKINLVDLAGSERADPMSQYNKGRLKEGANINKSLVTLGSVIQALAERSLFDLGTSDRRSSINGSTTSLWSSNNSERGSTETLNTSITSSSSPRRRNFYIPYRDSVLTWLLRDSLGGNARTIMIATISPTDLYYTETISTLRYAQRAKSIVNKPTVNEDPNVVLIRELRAEVVRLKTMLAHHWETKELKSSETQADSMISLSDSSSYLAEKLEENEAKARELTRTWFDKWHEAQEIMKESDMSIRPVSRTRSMGVIVDCFLPHLICMDADRLSTGILMFHLEEGATYIGTDAADREQDIALEGPDILEEHCVIKHCGDDVTLYPNPGAAISVNNRKVTRPVKLSQGDIILLGKTNMFRFNNPSEAARLRQRRQSGFDDTEDDDWDPLSLLLRQDSALSVGSDESSPGLRHSSSGIDMEIQCDDESDSEKLMQAKKELSELRDELQKAEDLRFEHEEEMWRMHELRKSEIAEQRRVLESLHGAEVQEHRQVLTMLMDEHERSQVEAELDIEEAKRGLTEDARAEYDRVTKEIERLKAVVEDDTGPAVLVTCSEPNLTQAGTAITVSAGTAASAAAGPLSPRLPASKSMQVVGAAAGAADLFGLEMFAKLSSSTDVSESGAAMERLSRKDKLTRMFLATSEKLSAERHKLKEKEKRFREIGSEQLEKVSQQSELIKRLQHRQKKLLKFIEEREPVSPEDIRAEPIGESCSEESLLSASSYTKQTTATRLKQQVKQKPLGDVPSSSHRKIINQARENFFNQPPTSSVQQAAPDLPKIQRAGSLPPAITVTPAAKGPHSHHHPPQRSRSEEKWDSDVSGKFNRSRTKKSPSPTGTAKEGKTSSIAQQVTSRLYNPEKIRKQFEAKYGVKKQTVATKQAPKPPKIPLRLLERHPTALHTRSRSAPSLHMPYPSDRRKNNRGPRRGNSREDMNAPPSPVSSSPSTDQVFWPSQEDFQYSMGSLEESREELDTIGRTNAAGHDRVMEARLGPVGGSDGSGNDSPGTSGPNLTIPVTSATIAAVPQHTAIPATHHSALNSFVPKDITDAKVEHFQLHFNANNPNQDSQKDISVTNQSREVLSGEDQGRGSIESNTVTVSCEQSSNDNSVLNRNTLPRNASHSETSMETEYSVPTDSACVAEAQKRTQNDPPSDSDISVSKKLKEDPEPSKKAGTEAHLAENVTDPNVDICVNTELHKEYQTSSETLSPLSPMEEEYAGSGSGKRLSDSGYNTTGIYLSEENLSLRSRGHTLKDVETFSEDSLDNLIEANDSLNETGQTMDDDTTSNIEQLKQYFQEQNEFDEREEIEKLTEVGDGESCGGHISEDSLEESVYGISRSDRLRLGYSSPQLHVNENSTDNERFAKSLPVSLMDHKVPSKPKQSQGLNYPEQPHENQWQSYLHTASDEEDKLTDSGQYPEKQLGPVDSNNDKLEVHSALKQTLQAENQCTADVDEVTPLNAGCTDSRESLDENDNHPRLSSQNVSLKHTLVPKNLHGMLDQKDNIPGYDQSQFEDDNVVEQNQDLEQNSREFVDVDVTQECIREDIADALMGDNDVIMENSNVISYVDTIGAGDCVNVLALDGKNGTSVYVITDGNLPLTGGGDGPVREASCSDFPEQCLTQMSDDRKSEEELESRSKRDDNTYRCPSKANSERMEMKVETGDGGGHESAELDDSLHSIPPLPINRHDDLPEVPPVPLQLSDNEAIPSPSAKVSPPASPTKIAHRMSPLIHVPSEPLLNPSTSFVNTKITSPRSPRRPHRPRSARSLNSQHDDDSSTSDESTHVTTPRSRPTSGRRRTRTQERRRSSDSNSCVSTDHESSYSEDEFLQISDDAHGTAASNKETSIVAFYVSSSSTTSEEDQGATLAARGTGKRETPGSDIAEVCDSGAGISGMIRSSDDDSEISDMKKSKLSSGTYDDTYKLQKVEDEPVFSPRKSCAELLSSGSAESQTAEEITRTSSVIEGDCEIMDIEGEGSYTETDGSNSAVEITQLNKTGNCTDTPNGQNQLTKLLHLESNEQELVASKLEPEVKDYSNDFDTDRNNSNDGNMKHELSSPPPDVASWDSENGNLVYCCGEPLYEHGNKVSAHGISGLETSNTNDTSDTEDGTCDSTAVVGEIVNSNTTRTVPNEQVTPVTNTVLSRAMSDIVDGKKIVQSKDIKLKAVAELTSEVKVLVNGSSDVSEAKDYSDDFDSTDSHESWDAVSRLKLLNAPVETVQTDSELDMAVSDHDEPLMKLETLMDDLNKTVVNVTITDNSENKRRPCKDAIGEVLAETIAKIGLPRCVVTSVESSGVADTQENSNDTNSEDKNVMDDNVGEENAVNINIEKVKTDGEIEVETSDQESPLMDLSASLIQGENIAPIIHKPPTHPDSSHGNTWLNIWLNESRTNDTDEYEYIDDFDSDSKGSDDSNNLKLLKLPVEVVNTDSELELATSDHEEPLMDLSTASGELKHDDLVEKMQGNVICTSLSNGIEMCQGVKRESELKTTMEELVGSREGELQNNIEPKLVDDVMSLVTIPSGALSDECEEGKDQDMDSDDFDADRKNLEENISLECNSKLKPLNLPTERVATDSEMEITTSDQEELLMNLTSESHDLVVRKPKANRDSDDDDDMDQFAEGIRESNRVSFPTSVINAGLLGFASPRMGDFPSAHSEGAIGGRRSESRDDVVQTVQSPATVQSEDEGYDTLMPVHPNLEHGIHDETLDSIADIVHDSGRTSPATRTHQTASERTANTPTQEPAESGAASAEGSLAVGSGAQETENSGAMSRTLVPGDFISIEMSDGGLHVADDSQPSTPSGSNDPGTYRLVHFKAPEPRSKSKRPKLDPNRGGQLGASEYVNLDTTNLTQAMRELPQASGQGVVELTDGDIRPAEINVTLTSDIQHPQGTTQKRKRPAGSSTEESVMNGSTRAPATVEMTNDGHVNTASEQLSADKQSQSNSINGNFEDLESNVHFEPVHLAPEQNETPNDIVSADSVGTDVTNVQTLKLADGAHETRTKSASISKSKPVQHAEHLGDTDIVSVTVPPGKPAPQSDQSVTNTEKDARQEILMLSRSTVRHPSNNDSANSLNNEGSGSVTENEFQVIGIQPLPKEQEQHVEKLPEQVLREHPDAPCYHNLRHSELNIEIRPWKVSDVRTSVTTEMTSQRNGVADFGDKMVESSGNGEDEEEEEEENSTSGSNEVNDDDIELPANEVTGSGVNVAGQNVMTENVPNDSTNNIFSSPRDDSNLEVATNEVDVCENVEDTSCDYGELSTFEGQCNLDGATLPSKEILRSINNETAENEHNAVARMIAQRMLSELIGNDKNDTSGGTTMSEPNGLEDNVAEEGIDTEMVSQSSYAIDDTSESSNVQDPSSVIVTSDTNHEKQSNGDLVTPFEGTTLTNSDASGAMDGNCSSADGDSDSVVNGNNAVAQMIPDKMLSEQYHSPKQLADVSTVPTDGKPERSNITSQKRDQIDAALVDSDDEQSPAKVQKVSRSLMSSEENVDKRLDNIDAPATALADVKEVMPEMILLSDVEQSEIEGKTKGLKTEREESSVTDKIKDCKESPALERQHVDLAQVLETFEDLPHGTTVHVMHQVECLAEEPEDKLLADDGTFDGAGETMISPTKSNWIISVDDEAGTSVDPQDHEPTRGKDETDLIPVDSDGPGCPGSVVRGTSGDSRDKAWVTMEETEMLEKVITAERAGLVVVDEVDTANVDSDGGDAGKAAAVSESDMNVPALKGWCKQQEVFDQMKAQPHENEAIDEGMPQSVESEIGISAIRAQREERRPIAAVQPRQSQAPSDIEGRDAEDVLPAHEIAPMVTEGHDERQGTVLDHHHPSNVDAVVPLEDLEEPDFTDEQPMNTGIGSTTQVSEVTAEEDVRVELLESPRRNIEHEEHILSPRGRELHQPIVVRQISESLTTDATKLEDEGRNSTTHQGGNDESTNSAFQETQLIGNDEITEEELVRFRGVNLRGRSVTPMRHTRPGYHRRSRSLSPHALEDAFFKMTEADSEKCLVESAIQTDPLSSTSSSSKSSPKNRVKQTKGSPRLMHRGSSNNTSRSISPIDSSSESSALVQQALATIRSAMETQTEYYPESIRGPTERREEEQQVGQNTVQKREDGRRTENICLQTGDSLDDIPAATEVEEIEEIVDHTFEAELEHSSILLQDPNSSDEIASSNSKEHLDHMDAADNLNSGMPSSIAPRSSTPTSNEDLLYPCQHVDLSSTQEEGRTRDQASGIDTTFVPEVLDQQDSYESPENSDATTVVSVSVGRVDPMLNTVLATQTITDVPSEFLEAASGQRSFAVQAGDGGERDGHVISGDAVGSSEGHRSFAVQATDLDTEVDDRTMIDLTIPENELDSRDHLDIATGQRSMAIQAFDPEEVDTVRSFGVQVFVQNLGRSTAESGDEQQRPVTVSGPLREALEAASNTDTDNHPPLTSRIENMNNSIASDLDGGDNFSLSTAQTRTIETQTYPELRVIETQTSMEMHGMETQTSPKELVEGEATQTDVFSMEEISVQTPAEMAVSVIDPEMILYHSAIDISPAAESDQVPTVVCEEISRPECDKIITRQPAVAESLVARSRSNVEVGNVADDVEIEIRRCSSSFSGADTVFEAHGEDVETEKELESIILSPEDVKDTKEDHLSVSELDLNNVDLETLKAQHRKLLEMLKKSKEKTARRIKDRKVLQEKTRKVEGWIDSNLDELHDDENEMKSTDNNVNKDANKTVRGSSENGQPDSMTYIKDSSGGSQAETLSDVTFLTGAFLGKAEQPLLNAPYHSPKNFSDAGDATQHLVTAEQRASSTSPPSLESRSPASSESESLITVKEVTPVRKLTGSSGTPASLTSSAESFATAVTDFDADRKNNQSTSSAADISVESYSTADNEVPIENLEHFAIKRPEVLIGKGVQLKATEVACTMAEMKENSGSSHEHQSSIVEGVKDWVPESLETEVPGSSEILDISEYDIPSNDSSRLSEYGLHLDTSSESNQGSIGSPMSTWFIPPELINVQDSLDLYDSPVVEDVILKHDAPPRQEADTEIFSQFSEVFPDSNNQLLPRNPRSEMESKSEEQRLQELEQLVRQQNEGDSLIRDDVDMAGTPAKGRPVLEPVPVATSSPAKPTKLSAPAGDSTRGDNDGNNVLYGEELNVSLGSSVTEDRLLRETSTPGRPDSNLDRRINQAFNSVDNFTEKSPTKENDLKDGDNVRISSSGGELPQELRDGNYSVPRVVLDSETHPQKGVSFDTAGTLIDGISPDSPGTLRKCASDSNMATGELEVPKAGNLDISASGSIEDWTQTDDLGSSWTRDVGFADSGTDPDNNDLLDELERLRRERQRIVDMLAKDLMPSKLQVELAEAQLNYIIGQTDTLLQTLDQSELDTDTLLELSLPDAQLKSITNQYMSQYKASLEMSKKQIELKISMLEKEKDRSGRIMQRSRKLAQVRRQAELEAFKLERQREQVNYERQKLMPRSRSDSPRCRSQEELRTESPDPNVEIPLAPIYARYMTPKQMQKHLSKLRKGLIQSNKKRPQSASPARTTSSSLLSGIHSPSHSSPGPAPWRDNSSIYNDAGAYDLYSPHTLSPATSLQSDLSSAGHVPLLVDPLGDYGRETAERYGYDLHIGPPHTFHGRPETPPHSRTSSRSPPRQHHHGTSQQYSPRGFYATPPPYSSVRGARYYPSQESPNHDVTCYNAQPTHYVPGSTPGGARSYGRYYALPPHPAPEGVSHGAPGYYTNRHAAESLYSASAHHTGSVREFGVGGSITSLSSSLDEDSERLLSEYQLARSRAEAEIQRARQTLQLPHKPTTAYSRPGTSPLVTAEYKSVVQSQPQIDKPASVVERTNIEKEIDSEIEQLKKKYGEIAKDVNPHSLTYRSSYGSEAPLSTWGRMTESHRPMPRPSNILNKYRTGTL